MQHTARRTGGGAAATGAENEFVEHVIKLFDDEFARIVGDIVEVKRKIDETLESMEAVYTSEAATPVRAQKIGALQTSVKSYKGQLMQLEKLHANPFFPDEDVLRTQYREMLLIPRVLSIGIQKGRIVCHTEPLFGKDHESHWRRIGAFEISFDAKHPARYSFQWKNLDGAQGKFHGPPNIVDENCVGYGQVGCAGTEAGSIISLGYQNHDYPSLVAFAVRYPECAGARATKTIECWPTVSSLCVPRWYIDEFGE